MTAVDTFEQLIASQSTQELVPFLLQLDKAEMVPIRQKTKALARQLSEFKELSPRTWGSLITPAQRAMLFLTGLRTYSRQEALGRSFPLWYPDAAHEAAYWQVLEAARPAWLLDWLTQRAAVENWNLPAYPLLRELEARQLIPYHAPLVALAVPGLLVAAGQQLSLAATGPPAAGAVLAATLQQDAALLSRDLWLLFEFDSSVSTAQAYVQPPMPADFRQTPTPPGTPTPWQRWDAQHPPQVVTWLDLLQTWAAAGQLDRGELLTRSLLALRRSFRRPLLAWFKSLFLSLQPTAAERLAYQANLRELLAHPSPLVVNFALDQLNSVQQEPGFDLAALLQAAENLMTRTDLNSSLKALLTSFAKLWPRTPVAAPAVARLCAAALAQPDAAVQERAARNLAGLLAAKKPALSPAEAAAAVATINEAGNLLQAAARALLTPWLATAPPLETPAAYGPSAGFVPELSAATAVVPVADWPELLFLTGQVLKHDDPLALERWLDGLLRLKDSLPDDYATALRPYLLQQWPHLRGKPATELAALLRTPLLPSGHAGLVPALLLSWVRGAGRPLVPTVARQDKYHTADPLVAVQQQRLALVEARLHAPAGLPLLSTPSHAPYWVAPTALLTSLLAYEAAGQAPDPTDLAVALARLAHAHVADAAAARARLPRLQHPSLRALLAWLLGPVGEPLPGPAASPAPPRSTLRQVSRWLLGSAATPPTPLAAALPQLWAVAARTKEPGADFPALAALVGAELAELPGVAHPWQPTWHLPRLSRTYIDNWLPEKPEVTEEWVELRVAAPLAPATVPATLLYTLSATVLPAERRYGLHPYVPQLAAAFPFLVALVPQHPTPLYWHVLRLGEDFLPGEVLRPALLHLLAPGPALDEPAELLLALGLASELATCQALAVEVLLAAVAQGRVQPARLGYRLGQLLAAGFVPTQPLVLSLTQCRALDAATDAALRQLLDALLPALPAAPLRGTRRLLEAYADLVARTPLPAPPAVQARLREWSQSATLRKVCKSLLI